MAIVDSGPRCRLCGMVLNICSGEQLLTQLLALPATHSDNGGVTCEHLCSGRGTRLKGISQVP